MRDAHREREEKRDQPHVPPPLHVQLPPVHVTLHVAPGSQTVAHFPPAHVMLHVDPARHVDVQPPPVHETSHVDPAWHSVSQFPPVHVIEQFVRLLQTFEHRPITQLCVHDVPDAHGPPSPAIFPVLQSYAHATKRRAQASRIQRLARSKIPAIFGLEPASE